MKVRRERRTRLCVEQLESRLALSPVLADTSTNWSGFAVATKRGAVNSVVGSWVVPAVSGTGTSASSVWVGIDGYNSTTVEQIGTDSDVTNGTPQYYAWFEMFPRDMVLLRMPIHPGDTMSAGVFYNARTGKFRLAITDVTTGRSFATLQHAPGASRSSAEWIVEAPSLGSHTLPLANFDTVTISGAQATIGGATTSIANATGSGVAVYQVNMISEFGGEIAATSAVSDAGGPASSSFTTTYVSSDSFSFLPQRWWPFSWFHRRQPNRVGPLGATIAR
jgi:hypothetical protein